jgi:YjbE family integral membrane protein
MKGSMDIFSWEFLSALGAIIVIDVVLGGENALVIAMAAKKLPDDLRKKAMIWGTFGAIATRFLCVVALTYLLMIPGLRLIGGLALIFIAWKLTATDQNHGDVKAATTFWGAMGTIVMADTVMGLDNALAIAAASGGNWWLIIIGLFLSIPIILFGSTMVSKIMDRYPDSVFVGAYVLYVVAIKMIMAESFVATHIDPMHDLGEMALPWAGALIITIKQYFITRVMKAKAA